MPASPDDLMTLLDRLGIATTTVEHPPLHSVAESRDLRGQIPGAHTKNLFLKDKKGGLFLITAEETTVINLKRAHTLIGATGRVSFGKPELMMETLGVLPGAVTAFGLMNDTTGRVRFALDATLVAHDKINCHPLVNTRTTTLATSDLIAFVRSTGHEVHVVAFDEL